jgi:hypothetical protein
MLLSSLRSHELLYYHRYILPVSVNYLPLKLSPVHIKTSTSTGTWNKLHDSSEPHLSHQFIIPSFRIFLYFSWVLVRVGVSAGMVWPWRQYSITNLPFWRNASLTVWPHIVPLVGLYRITQYSILHTLHVDRYADRRGKLLITMTLHFTEFHQWRSPVEGRC